jgi:hypothetical protein
VIVARLAVALQTLRLQAASGREEVARHPGRSTEAREVGIAGGRTEQALAGSLEGRRGEARNASGQLAQWVSTESPGGRTSVRASSGFTDAVLNRQAGRGTGSGSRAGAGPAPTSTGESCTARGRSAAAPPAAGPYRVAEPSVATGLVAAIRARGAQLSARPSGSSPCVCSAFTLEAQASPGSGADVGRGARDAVAARCAATADSQQDTHAACSSRISATGSRRGHSGALHRHPPRVARPRRRSNRNAELNAKIESCRPRRRHHETATIARPCADRGPALRLLATRRRRRREALSAR